MDSFSFLGAKSLQGWWLWESKNSNATNYKWDWRDKKENFCLFIAPALHSRAAKAYWQANKHGFGSDNKLGVIPLKHDQFCKILKLQSEQLKVNKKISSSRMLKFYKDIHFQANQINNYVEWLDIIDTSLNDLISEY